MDKTVQFTIETTNKATNKALREKILANPGFGTHFTDHMVLIDYNPNLAWHNARVVPYAALKLDPAAAVFHYGQEIFEGIKAYSHKDGSIWTFRPEANAKRFQNSAKRLALPPLPTELFLESLKQLVTLDKNWVPKKLGESLYLRPFMIATEPFLGVRAAKQVTYLVIASPAGNYFKADMAPINIWLSEKFSRAGAGGTGTAKCGGNYAASLLAQEEAIANGCQQVCFVDANSKTFVEELGGMNIFFVFKDGRLVTPRLNGNILEGITRKSVLRLAKDAGMLVQEQDFSVDQWRQGIATQNIVEIFACGTAAIITPIASLKTSKETIGSFTQAGPITKSLRSQLLNIQTGQAPDVYGWKKRLV